MGSTSVDARVPFPAYKQDPIAVVSVANRLPGHSNTPSQLWNFLARDGIAENAPPSTRFNLAGHWDGSHKPTTIKTPGAMFLEDHDPADFDPAFFKTSTVAAMSMDPQQRMLLEVTYEALENAGISLEKISGEAFGCFVGSYAVDYLEMTLRDPGDRVDGITIGTARAILSNRISHFLNIKGASMTIDTACLGSLVAVDVACRYLQTAQVEGAIVAGVNLSMSPDVNMDLGAMRTACSASGRCHTFDAKADGYCKSEAIGCGILKRLDAALRDGDPIRAIIRGTATNSDGWTPGIASPLPEAQATAIRVAYAAASITDFHETGYLECHGTGTLAGDPIEVAAAASVLTVGRTSSNLLVIGSVKSNIGHSEPAAGISGLIKAVLTVEKNRIPGTPSFISPNPRIDFEGLKVSASRTSRPWPNPSKRIASVNSFGFGGSNAHVVLQDTTSYLADFAQTHVSSIADQTSSSLFDDDDDDDDPSTAKIPAFTRPNVLVFSANDEVALKATYSALRRHLINPSVKIKPSDLAFTLSERRSRMYYRGFVLADALELPEALTTGKESSVPPKIGYIFTGQGAQWPQMGKAILKLYAGTRHLLEKLDKALQSLPEPPSWSLIHELSDVRSPDHLRLPEFSQPLVTALQLVQFTALSEWGIKPSSVVGHSSGEIAAAYAAGFLRAEDAIKIAYYRGFAAKQLKASQTESIGMMAVGLGPEDVAPYIADLSETVQIACYNSPSSVTLSGKESDLTLVRGKLQADSHFARALQVDLAYHSTYMTAIGERYQKLVEENTGAPLPGNCDVIMYSSVTGCANTALKDPLYWKTNMVSPVRFDAAATSLLTAQDPTTVLIELGPSGALAGHFGQIRKALPGGGMNVQYMAAAKRGPDSARLLFEVAGRIFTMGGKVNIRKVNIDARVPDSVRPSIIIDLPNYVFNHSKKYWHESDASRDWRFKPYLDHDLLGSKVLGTPWSAPTFSKVLDLKDVPWLKEHKMGSDIIFPAAGFCALAIEALYQSSQMKGPVDGVTSSIQLSYRIRNATFDAALILEENVPAKIKTALTPSSIGSHGPWYHFKISSYSDDVVRDHSAGLIRLVQEKVPIITDHRADPLGSTMPGTLWYKAMATAGYGLGPSFLKQLEVESTSGQRYSRSLLDLTEPDSKWKQSSYPLHPVPLDMSFQALTPSMVAGVRSNIKSVLIPAIIDDLTVFAANVRPDRAISCTTSEYVGKGRLDDEKNYLSNATLHHPDTKVVIVRLNGMRYHRLDTGFEPLAAHTFCQVSWKPDIMFLSPRSIFLGQPNFTATTDQVLDIIAHKKPTLRVLEVSLDREDSDSVWFGRGEKGVRAAYLNFALSSGDPTALVTAQGKYESERATAFPLLDFTKPIAEVKDEEKHDLVVLKGHQVGIEAIEQAFKNARSVLSANGLVIFLQGSSKLSKSDESPVEETLVAGLAKAADLTMITQWLIDDGQCISISKAKATDEVVKAPTIKLFSFGGSQSLSATIVAALKEAGHDVSNADGSRVSNNDIALVLDELTGPVLTKLTAEQWDTLQELIGSRARTLWLTHGSQMEVTNPSGALIHGLLRTVRSEDPGLRLTTLDVGAPALPATVSAISSVLYQLASETVTTPVETEYVERQGIIHISRVIPDEGVNTYKMSDIPIDQLQKASLRDQKTLVRLRAECIGTLDSLVYGEISTDELLMEPNHLEVDIIAAGLNFKDVAVTMGIVPENEHLLGLEGAGIVRRVAHDVTTYKPGDRVVFFGKGTFANRIQVTTERTHKMPEKLSFTDAASITGVYLTTVYSLFNLGQLKKGDSVLIHSAAGGVGISAIKLALYKQAEIYVTVGTEEKRQFLEKEFGIPRCRMFSSRSTAFAREILAATNGRGIDVILNSLTGELLDETWRITADGGTMIEIGKRDILDRKQLAMEPFDRNCSYRALEFSHKQITDQRIADLLSQIFALYDQGHIGPVHPIKEFSFADITSAFAFLRSGKHMGKIVVTDLPGTKIHVPIRRAAKTVALKPEASYILVGGLKGLCGSLAISLAQRGAKHIIVMSRSGVQDARSQNIIKDCQSYGTTIYEARGDVATYCDVEKAFAVAPFPVRGVIQGAMVLRDKPFEAMTIDDYHTTLSSKVDGTLHLHNVAKQLGLDLDFFTLLSSISGVVGQKGQANYAAANVFMDSFSNYRIAQGLRANSVDLGVIEDVGYVAEQGGMAQHFDDKQWTGINETVLRKILDFSILQQISPLNADSGAQLITGIPVPQPVESTLAQDARFSTLFIPVDSSGAMARSSKGDSGKDIRAFSLLLKSGADNAALLPPAIDIVNKQFTKTLRLNEPMEPGKALTSYGLDSLTAVEFRNWVRLELKAELTTLEINNATSLIALCEKIISKLKMAAA